MAELNKRKVVIKILLTFMLVLLGSYVLYFEIGKDRNETPAVERIFDFDPEDVRGIVVKRQEVLLSFKKTSDQWAMVRPVESKANKKRVEGLLSVFNYGIVRKIDERPSDYGQYGLDRPEIEFSVKVGDDNAPMTLFIGSDNPTKISCYARIKDDPVVLLIGGAYKTELMRDLKFFQSS